MKFEIDTMTDAIALSKRGISKAAYFSTNDVINSSGDGKPKVGRDIDSLLYAVECLYDENCISGCIIYGVEIQGFDENRMTVQAIHVMIKSDDEGITDRVFYVKCVCTTKQEIKDYLSSKRVELRRKLLSLAEKLIPEDMR